MFPIYAGIDGLDVAFEAFVPPELRARLLQAKETARGREGQEPELVNISTEHHEAMYGHVYATGAKGGYAFIVDTGEEGEVWFIKDTDKWDWTVRVSVRAAGLAAYGYEGVKNRIFERFFKMGFNTIGAESVGRVDFAVDFLTDEAFSISPDTIIAHSACAIKEHAVAGDETDMQGEVHYSGRRVTGITVGTMPNRQVCVYDKKRDTIKKGKSYWWGIWGVDKEEAGRIWRLEVRLGKRALKERWGVSTFDELERYMAVLVAATLEDIRMMEAPEAVNVTRSQLHGMWKMGEEIAADALPCSEGVEEPEAVKQAIYGEVVKRFKKSTTGYIASTATILGYAPDEIPDIAPQLMDEALSWMRENPADLQRKVMKTSKKYRLYCPVPDTHQAHPDSGDDWQAGVGAWDAYLDAEIRRLRFSKSPTACPSASMRG